jgi:hypothetical protein
MKLLMTKFQNKSLFQEAVNCWLRYILAQPIDIDLRIVFLFTLQLVGINRVGELMEEARLMISNLPKIQFEGMLVLEKV